MKFEATVAVLTSKEQIIIIDAESLDHAKAMLDNANIKAFPDKWKVVTENISDTYVKPIEEDKK